MNWRNEVCFDFCSLELGQSLLCFLCLFLLRRKGFFIKGLEKVTEVAVTKFSWTVPNRTPSVTVKNTFSNYQRFMTNDCCFFTPA